MSRRKHKKSGLKDYFVPHRGNYYKPAFFSAASIAGVLLLVVLLEGAYLASTRVAFFQTDFLASVLPGALVSLANDDREAAGVGDLNADPLLAQAAQLKADDMAAKGYFSHVTPDGKQPWYWFDQVNYPYTYAGENLAVNFTDSKDVENAWMASPTHHANLVKPQYTQVGIGVANGKYQGKDATFVVQFFAARADGGKTAAASPAPAAGLSAPLAARRVILPATSTEEVVTKPASLAAASTNAPTSTPVQIASTSVLGAEVAPPSATASAAGFFGTLITSPTHDLIFILTALIVLVFILLIVAVFVKARIQYKEVIGGGLLLLIVLLALLIYTKNGKTPVQLPGDTQAAAVYSAFQ